MATQLEPFKLQCVAIGLRTFQYKQDEDRDVRADGRTPKQFKNVVCTVVFDSMSGPCDVFVPEEMYDEFAALQRRPTKDAPIPCVLLLQPEVYHEGSISKGGDRAYSNSRLAVRCVGGSVSREPAARRSA